jgi:hypothetical protein
MDVEARKYLESLNRKVAALASSIHEILLDEGCSSYVKTIYIGYDVGGEMVAALYGHADHVEVALAVSDLNTSPLLVDASHLTWRTLPLSAIVRSTNDLSTLKVLIKDACSRVREGQHDVKRDNEYFMRSRRERRGR